MGIQKCVDWSHIKEPSVLGGGGQHGLLGTKVPKRRGPESAHWSGRLALWLQEGGPCYTAEGS